MLSEIELIIFINKLIKTLICYLNYYVFKGYLESYDCLFLLFLHADSIIILYDIMPILKF